MNKLIQEFIQQNKEAAIAEQGFLNLYSRLQDEQQQLDFSQEMRHQNEILSYKKIKRTEKDNLTRSISILKQKEKQFNSWSKKLRSFISLTTKAKSSAQSKKVSSVMVRRRSKRINKKS